MPKKSLPSSDSQPSDKTSPDVPGGRWESREKLRRKSDEACLWKLNVQFAFKTNLDGEWVGGKLVINHRARTATALIPIRITDYPDFVQNLLTMENLPDVALEELLGFFTALNKTGL